MNHMKLVATIAASVGLLATLIATPALADCDYEGHQDGSHNGFVPDWSYAHSFRSEVPLLDQCARESEALACDQGEEGLDCAYDMQKVYRECIGVSVCDDLVQGWLEDGDVAPSDLGQAFQACLKFVAVAGGNDCDACVE
jgi:hypothetical protein